MASALKPAPPSTGAPTGPELGRANDATFGYTIGGKIPWSAFIDRHEYVTELTWPLSVHTFQRMRTDSQLAGLLAGVTLPIRRYRWSIDPNGARPEIISGICEDLNLPLLGEDPAGPRPRAKNRFSHDDHLRQVLDTAIVFGHAFFEQVGTIDENGLWRLVKLGSISPRSINVINVAPDGALVSLRQLVGISPPDIPVERLVAFPFEAERGNWIGRSMFRDCYKNWLIKDRLLRIDAINHEKAGGIHIPEAPPNATPSEIAALSTMAQSLVVGEHAGGAVPSGTKWNKVGSLGTDVIGSIRYHDESMARRFLMMFMTLGTTQTGARALGETFVDFFRSAQETIATWYAETMNEHVIEDWVDWNYGEDEELVPRLVYERVDEPIVPLPSGGPVTPAPKVTEPTAPLVQAVRSGAVTVDPEIRAALEESLEEGRRRPRAAADPSPLNLPARTLRREPYAHEIAAAVDFAALDSAWQAERDNLVASWLQIQRGQIDDLHAKIAAAGGDLGKLSRIEAAPAGAEVVEAAMARMAAAGATQALNEAAHQGVSGVTPDLAPVGARLAARAAATETLLARSFGEAASRKALSLAGGSLGPVAIADSVKAYLGGLSVSYLQDQLGGALTQALNAGRKASMEAAGSGTYWASELLDSNTCEPCTAIDGTEYATLEEAEADYVAGGYSECDGGPRCRGTLVKVYDTEAPATVE